MEGVFLDFKDCLNIFHLKLFGLHAKTALGAEVRNQDTDKEVPFSLEYTVRHTLLYFGPSGLLFHGLSSLINNLLIEISRNSFHEQQNLYLFF